ncbi:MAG TPA: FAD:protein FMN transferase [Acidimicrobiales bacterium]|nr:FAD:protein FMN transferase [Acidimicrobiales bacterium]
MAATVHTVEVMGTVVSFHVHASALTESDLAAALAEATASLRHDDATFSTWKPESPMSRLRRGELRLEDAPAEVAEVLDLCVAAGTLSQGWFDAYAMPGGVDPTGLVKGWSLERALAVLVNAGVSSAMVNGGGDIACHGEPPQGGPWRVGIRHPWRADALAAVLEVERAVATSGEYERGRHLFDPIGRPGPPPASATVTGPSLTLADALATAVAVGGDAVLDIVASIDGYDAYLIGADGSESATSGIRFSDANGPA